MDDQLNNLPKAEMLKSRKQIQLLFTKGNSLFVHPIKANWIQQPITVGLDIAGNIQIGVSVSKRNFKKAVDRNRIKRLLREAYRLNKQDFVEAVAERPYQLYIFFIFVDKSLPTFELLQEKMRICLKRLAEKTKNFK